ncbi:flagellar basal body-associated FliL family protein [Gilvimarinus agarilyticus]|uniref:flagellar basal body-associated FliL family protein n=1 Tax=unclassified Gilvimarinus TaxID=2642066 RepID=UPI001C089A4E|nr:MULTISPECIES: flagellar basal body-associated FliL family protein [unclassified Gilvimarinus]MBU2886328.1 flagellar basal body-associated FliL family protein [Gilvimarinus agarilyticus]MDO6571014.1 flagellar basal body-associated FliL family protein [Gilvimarinus sp. 2_MG-2023]MDO6747974.1 flagellar basal body-associated FliL family protein [Gilvimarinus sp. 1_MG-2023]
MTLKHWRALTIFLALLFCPLVWAQEGSEEDVVEGSIYIPMEPPFVVNYGGAGRLKYLKTELSLRVHDVHTASAVRHHMPLIRNTIVMLLSRQSEESITTTDGVERLRQTAKKEIIALLEAEQNAAEVLEVYFNNLIVQK